MVCFCTLPIFLYGMPIDLVTVIKKIQHNASCSFSSYAGGVSILLACGPNTTWFMPKCSGWIFKIEVCVKNEDGTFRHSQIRPLHGLEMSGITHCHIPEHYKLLTSSFFLSVASSWVLGISWICSSPSAFLLFVVFLRLIKKRERERDNIDAISWWDAYKHFMFNGTLVKWGPIKGCTFWSV